MAGDLPFEKPLVELQDKIKELRKFTEEQGIDFSEEVTRLEQKAKDLSEQIYGNLTPWQRVQLARHAERPTTLDLIQLIFTDFLEVHGDRLFGDDHAMVGGVAKLDGRPVTVLGHQKGKDTKENLMRNFGMAHPEGFRKALRIMQQADKFRRPIITFINTAGAYPGKTSEERGISEAVARNLREMAGFGVPIICIVIGEGGSGGALAISVGDRIYMLENTYYSVIAPESAAAILWKDSSLGMRAAESMKITAPDLQELGVIDAIIEEPFGGAHRDKILQAHLIKAKILEGLEQLDHLTPEQLVQGRYRKFKKIGQFASL